MNNLVPTGIIADRQAHTLSITWNDGHISAYTFSLLRHACPCAECRGGHDQMSAEPPEAVFDMPEEDNPSMRMVKIEPVGAYAITIEWEDGHHFGIYNWHYLRALCPCPACRELKSHGR